MSFTQTLCKKDNVTEASFSVKCCPKAQNL